MKSKNFPKLRQYLLYHKDGCSILSPYKNCDCGRDDAISELEGATTILDDLFRKNEQLFLLLCKELGLSYEDSGIEEVVDRIREIRRK
jgi:hypothetical protein